MRIKLASSRWRHLLTMLPLGALVGLIVGWLFKDLLFGVAVGCGLGVLFGLLLAVRNPGSV